MKNTIAERVADFLKRYPPFDLLSKEQLIEISGQVRITYLEKDSIVYKQDENGHDQFYVVHKGAVELKREEQDKVKTVDYCDEGDIFGLRPLFANESYAITAIAEEESIVYGIPIDTFKPIVTQNLNIGNFLIESFASNTKDPFSKEYTKKLYADDDVILKNDPEIFDLQPVKYVKKVVWAQPSTIIKEVAQLMNSKKVSSVILKENGVPLGIVTDKDFRNLVATGIVAIDRPVSEIMSSPVLCYPKHTTIAQAQISMMKHNVSHLCITKDGTSNSKVIGIVSDHDIVLMQGNNPSVLMKAIQKANSTKKLKAIHKKIQVLLKGYIRQNIPLTHISKIIFELNDATIKRVIDRTVEKIGEPPVEFAWISLGSQGRKEQLLHTDQDNAIIFEDVPADKSEEVRAYFLLLAKKVTKRLNIIGYEYCNADMMARNPKWTLSLSEWKKQFTKWTSTAGDDEILLCSIFFDYDISYGNSSLTTSLADHIFDITKDNQRFLSMLGVSALRNPSPMGFFRQFLVEKDGEHKDLFDLKKRALMPITDAGRLLILQHRVKNINNTAERFEKLAQLEPENKELYLSCSYVAKSLLKFRTKHGLMHNDSGRYIELAALTKEEKMKLKRCFKIITQVQELIKFRFNLSHFL
ncbi:DUF294 nucleotidyltransferase-like domain-containing protein [Zhouia spongiae]|uniref:DUF294 nucleotidyltransferase-like domain-containing protein n=1 Tax=Zhouia spongiae TaxID=2202721 RepID=A0ABY3YKV3_9FLAO|nr:DUF294 nucleotidyltransferase-like domain-containing protein [Zhouia spongiae]UNY98434.1 DUF294 nucleotidyltransferase-like domain-containing protein [Zhouia spongiae]